MTLEEVHPETLDYLRPLLRHTLDTGETVQLPYRAWFLHAQTLDGRLFVSLWWGIADSAPPLTMQVERSDPPRCTVSTTDSTDLDEFAATDADALGREIAWAWLMDGNGLTILSFAEARPPAKAQQKLIF